MSPAYDGHFFDIGLMTLAARLAAMGQQVQDQGKAERRLQHHHSERGNAARVFVSMDFREQAEG